MQCSICNALKRELGTEGQTEAVATLKQRARSNALVADDSPQDVLDNVILSSRKRRAHIATELYAHEVDVHGERSDQSPRVRAAASA
jgi:hypothetical protein